MNILQIMKSLTPSLLNPSLDFHFSIAKPSRHFPKMLPIFTKNCPHLLPKLPRTKTIFAPNKKHELF